MNLADKIAAVSKAVAGGITGGAAAAGQALLDGQITGGEWITIAVAALVGAGLVYAAPANRDPADDPDPAGKHEAPDA
jgi:hypothetical protein